MNHTSCRLWGKCWGDPACPVRLTVKWSGLQVFDGPVPTSGDTPDARQTANHEALCTWTIDNLTAGMVPVEITVHNGSASVNNILLNNIVAGRYVRLKSNSLDFVEIDYEKLPHSEVNIRVYTDEEFLALYGWSQDSPPDYVEYLEVSAENTWVDGNFNWRKKNGSWTDGKINARLNGVNHWFDPPYTEPYERNYFFQNGHTLSFDYLIEWDIP